MPISIKHKLIFFHAARTGGTSIERALGIYGGKRGILFGRARQHLTPKQMFRKKYFNFFKKKYKIEEEEIIDYFKFTFIRNPYDRMVSEYFWRKDAGRYAEKHDNFKDFVFFVKNAIENKINKHYTFWRLKPLWEYVYDRDGNKLVDYVGRFENLKKDFKIICDMAGVTKAKLRHYGKMERTAYQDYYNEDLRRIVHEIYREDFDLFGYFFEK